MTMAQKQSLFREINERIRQIAAATDSDTLGLICECARSECAEEIAIPPGEFDNVREVPGWFIVRPGHEDVMAERVVRREDRFVVVGLMEEAGAVARD
jgi:8-oxo-dGTP pyrophosphatase MutT (NUDIX family)